jgi:hypothetical protein
MCRILRRPLPLAVLLSLIKSLNNLLSNPTIVSQSNEYENPENTEISLSNYALENIHRLLYVCLALIKKKHMSIQKIIEI